MNESTNQQAAELAEQIARELNYLYYAAYHAGHHDTVERQYTHVVAADRFEYHKDAVEECLSFGDTPILKSLASVLAEKNKHIVELEKEVSRLISANEHWHLRSGQLKTSEETLIQEMDSLRADKEAAEKTVRDLTDELSAQANIMDQQRRDKEAAVGLLREVIEACAVFDSPLEQLKNWNEYKQDAKDKLIAARAYLARLAHPGETMT